MSYCLLATGPNCCASATAPLSCCPPQRLPPSATAPPLPNWCCRRCAAFIQQGGFLAIFAKLFISGFFFAYLFRSSPFNSDKVDMLVTTSQLCTLATLFFALMMKIGFFEEEGVPKDVMGQILIYIMFLPMVLAVYIVGNALHETLFTKCLQGCGFGFTKTVRFIKMSGRFLDKHIRLD